MEAIKLFIQKNKREPSAHDFKRLNGLPTARMIQRKFGGIVALRLEMGLYPNHTAGNMRTRTAIEINQRSSELTQATYQKLLTYFKEPFIHRESSIFDDERRRTDFKVYGKKTFLVDIFFPKDRYSLLGCVKSKVNKYPLNLRDYMGNSFDKVIFLNLNDKVPNNIKVDKDFHLMSQEEFGNYCQTML